VPDTVILQGHLTKLWDSCPAQEPLQVGIWLFNLVPDELHTLSLFEDDEKRHRISTVVDELNQRYGQNSVYFGGFTQCSTLLRRESRSHPFLIWMTSDF